MSSGTTSSSSGGSGSVGLPSNTSTRVVSSATCLVSLVRSGVTVGGVAFVIGQEVSDPDIAVTFMLADHPTRGTLINPTDIFWQKQGNNDYILHNHSTLLTPAYTI